MDVSIFQVYVFWVSAKRPQRQVPATDSHVSAEKSQKKDRVKEQIGLNVSTLYIAQVKKKCGLDVGENYNKPNADNAKSLQCPPEKEAAIQDALKWFGML